MNVNEKKLWGFVVLPFNDSAKTSSGDSNSSASHSSSANIDAQDDNENEEKEAFENEHCESANEHVDSDREETSRTQEKFPSSSSNASKEYEDAKNDFPDCEWLDSQKTSVKNTKVKQSKQSKLSKLPSFYEKAVPSYEKASSSSSPANEILVIRAVPGISSSKTI
jgi:hypothetical protein